MKDPGVARFGVASPVTVAGTNAGSDIQLSAVQLTTTAAEHAEKWTLRSTGMQKKVDAAAALSMGAWQIKTAGGAFLAPQSDGSYIFAAGVSYYLHVAFENPFSAAAAPTAAGDYVSWFEASIALLP